MFKRSVAAVCASVIVMFGVAPAASAAPRTHDKVVKAIDWDAPEPTPPSRFSIRAIDWD